MPVSQPLSVREAVDIAKRGVDALPALVVRGEVSGFRGPNARSGHCYFQLKDEASSMDAIVWRGIYQSAGFRLKDGLQVQMDGRFNVYNASGKLSFVARHVELAGEGLLRQQVAELARRLEREGLMEEGRKRPIPRFCSRVVVVTSLSGSVIEDVKRTLSRRNPLVEILVAGCSVQGSSAPPTIIRALAMAADARPDAILLVRGGGSFEDLMCFNDEALARAVAASPVPVVTGIGHEPDTSICDMVADRRCSTPTAAAESVAPGIDEIERSINDRQLRLVRAMSSQLEGETQRLGTLGELARRSLEVRISRERLRIEALAQRRCLTDPYASYEDLSAQLELTEQRLRDAPLRSLVHRAQSLESLGQSLHVAGPQTWRRLGFEVERDGALLRGIAARMLRPHEADLARSAAALDALSPLRVLVRGYSVVRDGSGHVMGDAGGASVGDTIEVTMARGSLEAEVKDIRLDEDVRR
ncbi:exodeoxyribonuclease VII large subunit [Olsenella uli]|uniref:exodeoxyribonuclease VII large subunit n=1 Tax=Olsenella uli TaxID=133926 RepID=UPI0024A91C49|nr:exodeoxyribonuclease VII large subunit [Olsenella uli]